MYCKSCGHRIDAGTRVCPYCGRPVGEMTGGNAFFVPEPADHGSGPAVPVNDTKAGSAVDMKSGSSVYVDDTNAAEEVEALEKKLIKREKQTNAALRRMTLIMILAVILSIVCIAVSCISMINSRRVINALTTDVESLKAEIEKVDEDSRRNINALTTEVESLKEEIEKKNDNLNPAGQPDDGQPEAPVDPDHGEPEAPGGPDNGQPEVPGGPDNGQPEAPGGPGNNQTPGYPGYSQTENTVEQESNNGQN